MSLKIHSKSWRLLALTEDQINIIKVVLEILRKTLIAEEVSMAVNTKNGNLIFFSTKDYYDNPNSYTQYSVPLESLVK